MNMTILRALERLEMDVDLEVTTEVNSIDYDCDPENWEDDNEDWKMTIYGTQANGELYYIVLDQHLLGRIEYMLSTCTREWHSKVTSDGPEA